MIILMSVLLKIDDYFNFSSTLKYEISIRLIFNPAIIKQILNSRVNVGNKTWSWGLGNAPLRLPLSLSVYGPGTKRLSIFYI